jgi:hypothetical protein
MLPPLDSAGFRLLSSSIPPDFDLNGKYDTIRKPGQNYDEMAPATLTKLVVSTRVARDELFEHYGARVNAQPDDVNVSQPN